MADHYTLKPCGGQEFQSTASLSVVIFLALAGVRGHRIRRCDQSQQVHANKQYKEASRQRIFYYNSQINT